MVRLGLVIYTFGIVSHRGQAEEVRATVLVG